MARKSSYIINRRNTELWKKDTIQSISLYNDWFLNFAPATYTKERRRAMEQVGLAINQTNNFHFTTTHLKEHHYSENGNNSPYCTRKAYGIFRC